MKRPDARGGRLDARRAKPARARHGARVGAPSRPSSATRAPGAGSRSAGVSSARAMALGCATGFRPGDRRELRSRRVLGHAVARINGWSSYRFIHCDLLTRRVPACRVERVAPVSASGPKASRSGETYMVTKLRYHSQKAVSHRFCLRAQTNIALKSRPSQHTASLTVAPSRATVTWDPARARPPPAWATARTSTRTATARTGPRSSTWTCAPSSRSATQPWTVFSTKTRCSSAWRSSPPRARGAVGAVHVPQGV